MRLARHRLCVLLTVLIFAACHLPFLGAPYTNTEQWTAAAAHQIYDGSLHRGLATYQFAVSSPPLFVFSIVPFYAALGVSEFAARLSTLAAALLAILAVYALGKRYFSPGVGALASALLAASPLFWTYSGVICCNDAAFTLVTALLLWALVRATETDRVPAHVLAGMLLGLALVTKFNAGVYPIGIAAVLLPRWLRGRREQGVTGLLRTVLAYLPGLAIPLAYYATLVATTGHVLNTGVAPTNVTRAGEWALLMPPRLAYYLTWLGLFAGPMLLLTVERLWDRLGKAIVLKALAIAVPLNVFLVAAMNYAINRPDLDLGELRFGYIENLFPRAALWVFQFVGVTAGETLVLSLVSWGRTRPWPNGVLAAWTIAILGADSFWRGAQRYMVYLVPALAVFLADLALASRQHRPLRTLGLVAAAGTIAMGAAFGVFSNAYFAAEGRAAADVAAYVNAHGVRGIDAKKSDEVLCHCAYLVDAESFARPGETPRYVIKTYGVRGPVEGEVFLRDVRLLGVVWKRYGIVDAPASSPPVDDRTDWLMLR
jgi:4-amino-4-deoxy-L-arabinose transferase-like glycosyltransferase